MKKIAKIILMVGLIIVAAIFAYFIGYDSGKNIGQSEGFNSGKIIGRSDLENELKTKAESYAKTQNAAKEAASKYFTAIKFGDYKESYSYLCQNIKNQVSEEEYINRQNKNLDPAKAQLQDTTIDDVIVNNNSAKIRFAIIMNVVTDIGLVRDIKSSQQMAFELENNKWCALLSDSTLDKK